MKIKMTIEVQLEEGMNLHDDEERMWAENEVFVGDGSFIIHSNEIGDQVGVVKKVSNLKWIEE